MLGKDNKEVITNLVGIIVICLVIFVAFKFFPMSEIQGIIETAGIWAPLIFILSKASTMIFAPLSGSPLYPLAGALFGLTNGFIYIVIGDAIGAVVSFYISRLLGRNFVEKFARGNIQSIDKVLGFMENHKGFFITRVCFAALPEIASYAAGLTRIKFVPFFLIHNLVGLVPSAILVYSGVLMATFTANPGIMLAAVIASFAAAGFGGILLLGFVTKKKKVSTVVENKIDENKK